MQRKPAAVIDKEEVSSGLGALVFGAQPKFELDAILGGQEIAGRGRQ